MAAFWWTGRGFLSLLFLIGVFGAFEAIITLTLGEELFRSLPWLSGIGVLLAAAVNWYGGSKLNQRPLIPKRWEWKRRFTYRPPNRFMSLPMEIWSIPMGLLGLFLVVKGALGA